MAASHGAVRWGGHKACTNGREYRLPELPTSVWMVIMQRNTVYEFSGAIGKVASVNCFVTSSPQMETP